MLTAAFSLTAAADEHAVSGQPLQLSTAIGPAYPLGKAGDLWATLIRERSGGRLAVTYYPGATLVSRDATREFGALRDRAIDLAVGSTLVWSAVVPALNVLALPWIVPGADELEALLGGEIGRRLSTSLESSGVIALAWTGNGFVDLASTLPVHKPSDLAGLRVRAQPSPVVTETLAALAARPFAMSAANARALLDNGQLDAEETSVPGYSASQFYAGPLKHLLLWQAHADAMVFAVNRAVWDGWSEADRALVRGAALDASRQAHAMAQRLSDDDALAKLGSQGAVINRLTPAGKDAFREAVRAVYDRWTPVIGSDLVETAKATATSAPERR
jgi:TRAP-type transport system periplasmic protein